MSRAVQPQWGNTGAIRALGFGKTDEEARQSAEQQGLTVQPGCLHSDRQLESLARHIQTLPRPVPDLKERLNVTRELAVFGMLYREAEPSAKESNKALVMLGKCLDEFIWLAEALLHQPQADFPASEISDIPLQFRLPLQLMGFAEFARKAETPFESKSDRLACATAAERLAFVIQNLDGVSSRAFPSFISTDPSDNSLPSLQLHAKALQKTLKTTRLSQGRRQKHPPEFGQAVLWLRNLYEDAGGKFTHTPRQKTAYDGAPHSPAGKFVLEFFQHIDQKRFPPRMVSTLIAQAIKFRRNRKQGSQNLIAK